MLLFDVLALHHSEVTPRESKLHLATWDGRENPLKVFFAGRLEEWQSWQRRKNFERQFIVSLIKLPGRDRWLFAGCFRRLGRTWVDDPPHSHWSYETSEVEQVSDLAGRIVVIFHRTGRAAYLDADRWASDLEVRQLLERRMAVDEFPGYPNVLLSKQTLDIIVKHRISSWKGALSAVAGVYLIQDTKTGKLYVGSATGDVGLWSRWCLYSRNGHGGNAELRTLLENEGASYARNFRYAVLEIADTHAREEEVLRRELHWKQALGSREHGYNAN